jgi:hypothetical protein
MIGAAPTEDVGAQLAQLAGLHDGATGPSYRRVAYSNRLTRRRS